MAGPGWFFLLLGLVALGWGLRLLGGACLRANLTDWGRSGLNYLDGFNRIYCRRLHDLGDDSLVLPERGPAILVSNHVSGLDPVLLATRPDDRVHVLISLRSSHETLDSIQVQSSRQTTRASRLRGAGAPARSRSRTRSRS